MEKVTIKEIARRLGLDVSTVSRALAGKPNVSEVTRSKVLHAAKEMNYTPNLWAQNLVGAASSWIGCLVLDLTNPFYIPLVRDIEDIAGQNGYIIFLGESRRQLENEKALIERFRRINVAGVILSPVMSDLGHLEVLRKEGVPVVIAGRLAPGFDSVNVDNFRSGYLAGRYLSGLGHRQIGFVHSGSPFNPPEGERLRGLKASLAEVQLELAGEYVVGNNEIQGGELAAQKWLEEHTRPSVLFCSNDMLAMGLISRLLDEGVDVPGEVSVLGHDNVPFARMFKVPLTTVTFSTSQMAQKLMEILLARIHVQPGVPQTVLLEPELVERESCRAL